MRNNFDTVLDECLERIRNGEADTESCLAQYPEYSEDLRDILETALAFQDMGAPEPSHLAMDQGRDRLLQVVAERRLGKARGAGFLAGLLRKLLSPPALKLAGSMAALGVLMLVGIGVVLGAGNSLPGQVLYPVKLRIEDTRLALASSVPAKVSRHIDSAENRVEELATVAPYAEPQMITELSQSITHNLDEAQRLAASVSNGAELTQIKDRLESSALTHLGLLEGSLASVPDGSRAALGDALKLSSQGYAQAVEAVAIRAPSPLLAGIGFLQLRASDPPAPPLDNVFVEVEKIEAFLAAGSESEWITIEDSPNAFDLLHVEQVNKLLGQQEISAGTYTQIRFEITRAVVVAQGEAYIAEVPSGKLSFGRPFTVREGETTIVSIDFDGQRSVQLTDEGEYILTPEIKLLVSQPFNDGEESPGTPNGLQRAKVEIEGVIGSYSDTEWFVGGHSLNVIPETEVEGTPAIGLYAVAEVLVEPDGSFTALDLVVKGEKTTRLPVEIEGAIVALNGDTWTVDGYTVHLTGEATWQVGSQTITITTNAEIEGDPQVGHTAYVTGLLGPDGTLLALEIKVDAGTDAEHLGERVQLNGVVKVLQVAGMLQGVISSLSTADVVLETWNGDIIVSLADGTSFIINRDTKINGTLVLGAEARVEAVTSDGQLIAVQVDVK